MSLSKDSPQAPDDVQVTRWDRPRWISVFSSHNPTIREVTECLGLGLSASSSTTNRGIPKFDNPDYRKLSSEVTKLSKELPKERDALLDFAADPNSLDEELEELLNAFGPNIWGKDADRSCLLSPDASKKTYTKHLFYEEPEDKEILKIHLHRWIIIKACYYIRNMKLKRPSAAGDYDTLADMDAESAATSPKPQLVVNLPPLSSSSLRNILSQPQSPDRTPQSSTPPTLASSTFPGAEAGVRSIAGKKRKSSVFTSLSDGEEHAHTPVAKRPYQHHSMPVQRKSPRKSLKSLDGHDSAENIPPLPSQRSQTPNGHPNGLGLVQIQSAPPAPSTLEPGRPLVSLSSNDLNGAVRPVSSAPTSSATAPAPASGFTPVNNTTGAGSFTPVNVTAQAPSQGTPNARNYSSPYSGATAPTTSHPQNTSIPATIPASTPTSAPAPVLAAAPAPAGAMNAAPGGAHGFQAINSPIINGHSTRNSPVIQHSSHVNIAPHPPPQPPSRSHTPGGSSNPHSNSIHHPPSRSNTPGLSGPPPPPPPVTHAIHAPHPVVHAVPQNAVHYAPPPSQPILKSHPLEVKPANVVEVNLLQCEVLGALMQYLFPKASAPPDEAAVLQRIEYLWQYNSAAFRHQIGPLFDLQSRILSSWVTERRKITQLRHSMAIAPGVSAAEMVDRLLAMNDLRTMRLKWKNMSSQDGLSPEDLLCRTFAIMTNTDGTEYLFKDGLERLNDGVFEFLRNEDMRILMHKR